MRVDELAGRVFVDTNVLIYATLAADPRHESARQVLALRHQPEVELFISVLGIEGITPVNPFA